MRFSSLIRFKSIWKPSWSHPKTCKSWRTQSKLFSICKIEQTTPKHKTQGTRSSQGLIGSQAGFINKFNADSRLRGSASPNTWLELNSLSSQPNEKTQKTKTEKPLLFFTPHPGWQALWVKINIVRASCKIFKLKTWSQRELESKLFDSALFRQRHPKKTRSEQEGGAWGMWHVAWGVGVRRQHPPTVAKRKCWKLNKANKKKGKKAGRKSEEKRGKPGKLQPEHWRNKTNERREKWLKRGELKGGWEGVSRGEVTLRTQQKKDVSWEMCWKLRAAVGYLSIQEPRTFCSQTVFIWLRAAPLSTNLGHNSCGGRG